MGVSRKESRSLVYVKSNGRKWPKKGSSRLPEALVNNVYFGWKESATFQLRKVREVMIFLQEGSQFFPGRLGLNEGEIHLGQLRSPHS